MTDDIFEIGLYSLLFGVLLIIRAAYKLKTARVMRNMPTSKIRSLAMGRVEIYGKIKPHDKPVTSPFTGTECYFSSWKIEELVKSGKSSRWVVRKSGFLGKYFYIEDDTGKVLVDGSAAKLEVKPDFLSRTATTRIENFLQSQRLWHKDLFAKRLYRYAEINFQDGDTLYANGIAGKNPFVEYSTKNEDLIMISNRSNTTPLPNNVVPKQWFEIYDKPEKEFLGKKMLVGNVSLFSGGFLSIVGIVMMLGGLGVFN